MKRDPYFKYLAAIILAGVVVALFNPTPAGVKRAKASGLVAHPVPLHPAHG